MSGTLWRVEGWPLAPNRWVGVFLPRPAPLPRRLFNSLSCLLCNCSGLPRRRWIPQAGSHHGHHLAETTPVDHTCSASAAGPLQGLVSFTPALGDLRACFTTIALATHTQVSSPCLPPSSPTTHLSCYSHLGFWHAHHPEPVLGHGLDLGCPNWEELLLLLLWLPWHGNESTQIPPSQQLVDAQQMQRCSPKGPATSRCHLRPSSMGREDPIRSPRSVVQPLPCRGHNPLRAGGRCLSWGRFLQDRDCASPGAR